MGGGRQYQKLLKQQQGLDADLSQSDATESEDDSETGPSVPFNPFDLLDADDQAQHDQQTQEDSEDDMDEDTSTAQAPVAPPSSNKKASKKKKNKNKNSSSNNAAAGDKSKELTTTSKSPAAAQTVDEDIDSILQELNLVPSPSTTTSQQQQGKSNKASSSNIAAATAAERPLLSVDIKSLSPDDELKRIFGSRVVESARAEDAYGNTTQGAAQFAGASRRVRRLAARGLIRREQLKPGVLIKDPKEHWPKPDSGAFTLKSTWTTPDGCFKYTYDYSHSYEAVQALYEEVQQSFDPNAVAGLLQRYPYHLDALLTMSDLYRSTGENAYADEMIERCVYALELAWTPTFISNAVAGNARIDYEETNVPMFVALFRYIQSLGRRGLHKTALEVSKLLLSLNPDDPTGVVMCIDYFAVRAAQYKFLYRFVEEYNTGDQSVGLLPNFSYSLALAKWYQERSKSSNGNSAATKKSGEEESSSSSSSGLSSWSAKHLLVRAVLLHPLVVITLQHKVRESGVSLSGAWNKVLEHTFFTKELDPSQSNASLSHLVALFVERNALIWKAAPVQDFLLEACTTALAALDYDPTTSSSGLAALEDLPGDGLAPSDWAAVRHEAFPPGSEVNEYRHLRLYEFSDTPGRLPVEELHGGGGGMGGQLDAAEMEAQIRAAIQQAAREAGIERITPEDLQEANPFMTLLRSFLPWVAMGEQPDYAAEGGRNDDIGDDDEDIHGGDGGDAQ